VQKKQGEHIQGDVRVLNQLNVETPFTDVRDALQRLLPFHVSQAQFHCHQQLISTQGCQQQLQNTTACTSPCQRYGELADPKTPASIGSSAGSCRTQNVAAHKTHQACAQHLGCDVESCSSLGIAFPALPAAVQRSGCC
jgi:hypothetical protein